MGDVVSFGEGVNGDDVDMAYFVHSCKVTPLADDSTHHDLARLMIYKLSVDDKYPPVTADGDLYVLNKQTRIWEPMPMETVRTMVAENFGSAEAAISSCRRLGDYTGIAKHTMGLAARMDFFRQAPAGAALGDNFYRIARDGKLTIEPVHPMHRQRFVIPVTPKAGPMPMFMQYLKDTFAGDDEAGQIQLLQEIAGAALFGLAHRYQCAVLLYGPGETGKTTWANILLSMIPERFHAAVSPFDWEDKVLMADLAGSRINAVGELPEDEFIPAAVFKRFTGGDTFTARGIYKDPFRFKNEALHIFNSNHYISTKDRTSAFFRRWRILAFLNKVKPGSKDIDLVDKIVAQELPALLAWTMEGAQRVVQRNELLKTDTHNAMMNKWQLHSDSVLAFFDGCDEIRIAAGMNIKRDILYAIYVEWCTDENRRPLSKRKFYDRLDDPAVTALGVKAKKVDGIRQITGVMKAMFDKKEDPPVVAAWDK